MPTIKINDCNIYYEIHGEGSESIIFSHGLLWSGKLFHKQVDYLKSKYKIITYDHRGQGQSEVTETGYDMDSLTEDVTQLVERLKLGKVHFVGLSMGGFVAMRLAARRPDLIKSAILIETSAEPEPNAAKYTLLNTIVKLFGISSVANTVMKIMFGNTFLNNSKRKAEKAEWTNELKANKKSIVKAVKGVITRNGIENELANIKCPTLILVGNEDKATVPKKAEFIHSKIPQSKLVYVKNAGHSSSIEEPEQVNMAIESFLIGLENS